MPKLPAPLASLVVGERAVGDSQRGAAEVIDAAADAAAEEGGAAAAEGLVAAKGRGRDDGAALVQQAAAEDIDRVGSGGRRVVAQGILIQDQSGTDLVEDAAPAVAGDRGASRVVRTGEAAVGDGQTGQGHGRVVADVEDPAGVIAADG